MKELITKALLSGLGFASLTKEAIQKTAEDLVDQSKISEEEGRRLVKDFQRRSAKAEKGLEKKALAAVNKVLKNLKLPVVVAHPKGGNVARKGTGKGLGKGRKTGSARKAARR
jgi:polyhydroxyalkanoate synthesis regulator phasin